MEILVKKNSKKTSFILDILKGISVFLVILLVYIFHDYVSLKIFIGALVLLIIIFASDYYSDKKNKVE